MLFNSIVFLIFITLFFFLWKLFSKNKKKRWFFLTLCSFIFYGWTDWRFIFLLLGSGLIDFYSTLGIVRFPKRKKLFLIASILGNVGSLAVFKYLNFLTSNLNSVLISFGFSEMATYIQPTHLALPIGISFYTFQSMSYTIDVYRGKLSPTRNILHFFSYLSMFPQLVAGPIERARHLLPQLEQWIKPTEQQRWDGYKLIIYGYFKKVVIADNLAPVINLAFGLKYPILSAPYWLIIVSMFAFQIYFDFSGYSDIARGLAKTMGYEFNLNFNRPYIATSMKDFWKRWHISLSSWFRDYLYIPLGGSKKSEWRNQVNLWITMLIAGLWHGAAWTFIVWGGLHALYLHIERKTKWPTYLGEKRGEKLLVHVLVLIQVWVAWIFFRAESMEQALNILGVLGNFKYFTIDSLSTFQTFPLIILMVCFLWEFGFFRKRRWERCVPARRHKLIEFIWVCIITFMCVFMRGPGNAFIYFQF